MAWDPWSDQTKLTLALADLFSPKRNFFSWPPGEGEGHELLSAVIAGKVGPNQRLGAPERCCTAGGLTATS